MDAETQYRKRYLDLLVSADTRRDFELRSAVVASIRRTLDAAGFVEVETPILQPRYGGAFAEPFVTLSNALDADLYLRIATELYLKRLIVGGLGRSTSSARTSGTKACPTSTSPNSRCWSGTRHMPITVMLRIEHLVATVAQEAVGTTTASLRGFDRPGAALAAAQARGRPRGLGFWTRDEADLRARLEERGVDTAADRSWEQLVDHALSHFVEPELIEPTVSTTTRSSSRRSPGERERSGPHQRRFEYFAARMELGNAHTRS